MAKKAVAGGPSPRSVSFSPDGKRLAVTQVYRVGVDIVSARTLDPITHVDTSAFNNTNTLTSTWSPDGQTLYFAGGYADADWEYPIIAWKDGVTHAIRDVAQGSEGGINDFKTLPDGSIAYATHDPSFGIFDPQGKLRMVRRQVTADMRNKYGGRFFNAPDATSVWFGLKLGAVDPWLFDVTACRSTRRRTCRRASSSRSSTRSRSRTGTTPTSPPSIPSCSPPSASARWRAAWRSCRTSRASSSAPTGRLPSSTARARRIWRRYPESFVWGVTLLADGQIIIAALGDGTLRWYRSSDGTELLSLFVNAADHKWIAWTPKGYYAAAAGART